MADPEQITTLGELAAALNEYAAQDSNFPIVGVNLGRAGLRTLEITPRTDNHTAIILDSFASIHIQTTMSTNPSTASTIIVFDRSLDTHGYQNIFNQLIQMSRMPGVEQPIISTEPDKRPLEKGHRIKVEDRRRIAKAGALAEMLTEDGGFPTAFFPSH
ncbi:MAG: hypothetical protein SFX19_04090 [Alphaproteobacteria bacterium]|nr:hypothetical protein [Alphaproteobacteria bacterium]